MCDQCVSKSLLRAEATNIIITMARNGCMFCTASLHCQSLEKLLIEEGDTAHFESHLPHRLIARGGREAEVLVVAAPNWSKPINANFKKHRLSLLAGSRLCRGQTRFRPLPQN